MLGVCPALCDRPWLSRAEFDECSTGFHDCAERARCVDTATGYTCICPVGWEGKTMARLTDDSLPVANGRQCIGRLSAFSLLMYSVCVCVCV